MARKKKDGLIEIISLMPWWLNLALAAIVPVMLHAYAVRPATPVDPQNLNAMLTGAIFKSLVSVGQYVAPLLFLVGALVSFIGQRRRRALLDNLPRVSKALDGLTWQQFERLVGEAFRRQGFAVEETGGSSPDGGIDLVLRKDGERFLVQCKQWRALKVGVTTVRELYGVMAADGAVGGFVVTSGRFTDEARRFAEGRNVRLVDGAEVERWVAVSRTNPAEPVVDTHVASAPASPRCPSCQSAMVLRTARRGTNAGAQFWGCVGYPQCFGKRSV